MSFACTIAEVTPSLYDAATVGWFIHPHTIETFHLDMEANIFVVQYMYLFRFAHCCNATLHFGGVQEIKLAKSKHGNSPDHFHSDLAEANTDLPTKTDK